MGAEQALEPSPGRLLFRFAIGVTELAGEGLAAALQMFERLGASAPLPPEPTPPLAPRHALIGALSGVPAWIASTVNDGFLISARALRAVSPRHPLLRRLPGVGYLRRRTDAWRDQSRATVERWAELGRREEQAGRSIARVTLTTFFEEAVARIADSPELKRVIEEQSQSLTVTAMSELRDTSARADGMVESIARRFLPRRRAK